MTPELLHQTTGPVLHLRVAGAGEFNDDWRHTNATLPNFASRVVRGRKAGTYSALFDEVAAALQFPFYFGENWNALDDCLTDLAWLPAEGYLLWIAEAPRLLEHEPQAELATFVEVVAGAADAWRRGETAESHGRATPFHVVLQVDRDEEPPFDLRLATAGAQFDRWPAAGK